MLDLHDLDKRVYSLEEFRERMETVDLPSINETIQKEIPQHYSRKIKQSEETTMLKIGQLIDKKLNARFGWMSRILEGIVQAALIALLIKLTGLAS